MANTYADRCKQCRRSESEHHPFQAPSIPEGCMCDPHEWFIQIPEPCSAFKAEPDGLCECEHLRECHKPEALLG